MKFDTVEKAKRILPSYVMFLADGINDIHVLRHRVRIEQAKLIDLLTEKACETHSGSFITAEMKEIDRKIQQLGNFWELTK